ncbi:hypothetical protein [Brevibacillus reuszeri]|uniref:hypothetical protein n=1 Tax=Brevibacillus reuszeri TaxID=54915 RepID=UPI002896FA2C|nr:hypothetical protein [Brevibacillus reuszeri]
MRRIMYLLMTLVLLFPTVVSAHIVNEQNLYDDLEYSKAKTEIVYLSGLGIIPYDHHGSTLFAPQDKLTRGDLAVWVGTFMGAADKEASHDDIMAAAVKKGLVSAVDGNATYADVNQAYFKGKVALSNANQELTKEEFALFMAEHLSDSIDGKTIYDQGGFIPGPNGKVEKVTVQEEKDGAGNSVKVYALTLAGNNYVLSAHPRILQASVDPAEWEGKNIQESWLISVDGKQQLQLIRFEKAGATMASKPATGNEHAGHEHAAKAEGQADSASDFPWAPIVTGAILVVIVGVFLFNRKKGVKK